MNTEKITIELARREITAAHITCKELHIITQCVKSLTVGTGW